MGGESPDNDTLTAYICFVNFGWEPSKYDALPPREKALVRAFVLKLSKANESLNQKMGR